jgi:hypothetical protein
MNTAPGKIKWRGSMDRCHPEIHNGSPSTERKTRGLRFHSLSMGHLNQLCNTFPLERALGPITLVQTLDADVLAHFLLH